MPFRPSERNTLAEAIKAGRRAERGGGYELTRGISSYSKWLGVDLIQEADQLAKRHGPIEVLDAGGGKGVAMAKLKKALENKIKETHVTTLVQPYPKRRDAEGELKSPPIPFRYAHKPTFHVAHIEKLPIASASMHLVVSVRGATWYTGSRLNYAVAELVRTMRPGARAFLHITEPNGPMRDQLKLLFSRERIKYRYKYGVVGANQKGADVQNEIHVVEDEAQRNRIAAGLKGFQNVTKYRVLCLEKEQ